MIFTDKFWFFFLSIKYKVKIEGIAIINKIIEGKKVHINSKLGNSLYFLFKYLFK